MIDQLRGIFLLCALYVPAAFLASHFGIGIPGAVAGLVLCFLAMLLFRRLQVLIRPGAVVVLTLMPLFLVPLLVRMALTLDFTSVRIWTIVVAMAVSSLLSVVLTAWCVKFLLRDEEKA